MKLNSRCFVRTVEKRSTLFYWVDERQLVATFDPVRKESKLESTQRKGEPRDGEEEPVLMLLFVSLIQHCLDFVGTGLLNQFDLVFCP